MLPTYIYIYACLCPDSFKPQKISPKFMGTVRQLLHKKIRDAYVHPQFVSDVMKPMSIEA
jgi:ATP-binding cassette subfamily E protein 1